MTRDVKSVKTNSFYLKKKKWEIEIILTVIVIIYYIFGELIVILENRRGPKLGVRGDLDLPPPLDGPKYQNKT
jgi:hypothetical protein